MEWWSGASLGARRLCRIVFAEPEAALCRDGSQAAAAAAHLLLRVVWEGAHAATVAGALVSPPEQLLHTEPGSINGTVPEQQASWVSPPQWALEEAGLAGSGQATPTGGDIPPPRAVSVAISGSWYDATAGLQLPRRGVWDLFVGPRQALRPHQNVTVLPPEGMPLTGWIGSSVGAASIGAGQAAAWVPLGTFDRPGPALDEDGAVVGGEDDVQVTPSGVTVNLQPPPSAQARILAVWRGPDAWSASRVPVPPAFVDTNGTAPIALNATAGTGEHEALGGTGHPLDRPLATAALAARVQAALGTDRNTSLALSSAGRICLDPQAINYAGEGLEHLLARSDVLRAARSLLHLDLGQTNGTGTSGAAAGAQGQSGASALAANGQNQWSDVLSGPSVRAAVHRAYVSGLARTPLFEGVAGLVSPMVPLLSLAAARYAGPASAVRGAVGASLDDVVPVAALLGSLAAVEPAAADRWQALDGCVYAGGRGALLDVHRAPPESPSPRSPSHVAASPLVGSLAAMQWRHRPDGLRDTCGGVQQADNSTVRYGPATVAPAPRAPQEVRLLERTLSAPADLMGRSDVGAILSGLFMAPARGTYRFLVAHSRGVQLFVGHGHSPASASSLRRVAHSDSGYTSTTAFSLVFQPVTVPVAQAVLVVAAVEQGVGSTAILKLRVELRGADGEWVPLNGHPHGAPAAFFATAHATPQIVVSSRGQRGACDREAAWDSELGLVRSNGLGCDAPDSALSHALPQGLAIGAVASAAGLVGEGSAASSVVP